MGLDLFTRDFTTNATSPISAETIQGHYALILASDILHLIGGQIVLPFFFITLFISREAIKNPILLNFCFSWILQSSVALILFYGGHSVEKNPPIQLCMIQASLNYGAQAMTVVTSLGVVIQAWHYLRMSTIPDANPKIYGWRTTLIVSVSYAAFVGYASAAVIIGVQFPEDVGRTYNVFVCDIPHHRLATAVGWLCFGAGTALLVLDAWILVLIYQNRFAIRHWRLQHSSSDFGLILRTLAFTVYGLAIVLFSVLSVFGFNTDFIYMLTAICPLVAFILFATRPNTTRVWRRWFRLPPSKSDQLRRYSQVSTLQQSNQKQQTSPHPSKPKSKASPPNNDDYDSSPKQPLRRPPGPETHPSEMSFLARQQAESRRINVPLLARRGWSDAAEIFDLRDEDQDLHGHIIPDDSMQHGRGGGGEGSISSLTKGRYEYGSSDFGSEYDFGGKGIGRPELQARESAYQMHELQYMDGSGPGGGGKKVKRPAIIEWTSESFLPVAARHQSDGPF